MKTASTTGTPTQTQATTTSISASLPTQIASGSLWRSISRTSKSSQSARAASFAWTMTTLTNGNKATAPETGASSLDPSLETAQAASLTFPFTTNGWSQARGWLTWMKGQIWETGTWWHGSLLTRTSAGNELGPGESCTRNWGLMGSLSFEIRLRSGTKI